MTLDTVVRRALRRAPCSIRALARAAGVSHVLLAEIRRGRKAVTPRVARMVAAALEQWGTQCHVEAARVRTAVQGQQRRGSA
jgi:transcriptional regulator with XRE-family HTH domain